MNEEVKQGPRVIYPPELPNEERFTQWVSSYYGSNIIATYRTKRDEQLKQGLDVVALDIIDEMNRATRSIDLAKNEFRAKFKG